MLEPLPLCEGLELLPAGELDGLFLLPPVAESPPPQPIEPTAMKQATKRNARSFFTVLPSFQ